MVRARVRQLWNEPLHVFFSTLILSLWMLGSFYLFYSWLMPRLMAEGTKKLFWLYALTLVLIFIPAS
ncbi:MAG: hypothetical protein MZV63_55165 [Marinilabiliales bacterium]|nr:hypothetical protein [Marinilabiliales bacterium]